ncbi:MAG: hypothetical protein WBM90_05230 [Acidimicrobiia bacterium]
MSPIRIDPPIRIHAPQSSNPVSNPIRPPQAIRVHTTTVTASVHRVRWVVGDFIDERIATVFDRLFE